MTVSLIIFIYFAVQTVEMVYPFSIGTRNSGIAVDNGDRTFTSPNEAEDVALPRFALSLVPIIWNKIDRM